jgi:hypothetical protein
MRANHVSLGHLDRATLADGVAAALADAAGRVAGLRRSPFDFRLMFARLTPEGRAVLLRATPEQVLEAAAQAWIARARGLAMRGLRAGAYAALGAEARSVICGKIAAAQAALKIEAARGAETPAACT